MRSREARAIEAFSRDPQQHHVDEQLRSSALFAWRRGAGRHGVHAAGPRLIEEDWLALALQLRASIAAGYSWYDRPSCSTAFRREHIQLEESDHLPRGQGLPRSWRVAVVTLPSRCAFTKEAPSSSDGAQQSASSWSVTPGRHQHYGGKRSRSPRRGSEAGSGKSFAGHVVAVEDLGVCRNRLLEGPEQRRAHARG